MHLHDIFTAFLASASALRGGIIPEVSAFVYPAPPSPRARAATTHLNLENHIADMIDNEHERQRNIDQWRLKQTEKLNKLREPTLPSGFDFNTPADLKINGDAAMKVQMRKDRRMAKDDPSRYCADRCVSTGNCQVWEDMFDMDADEVQKFCKECVLSLDEEPCDIPEKFIENAGKNSWELRP
ncbi:hypothetical protein ACHAXA_001646 [Cyclostephanos tholiformis]|uniref:Uncharacterized protein n=1 Tax=Cyclostephanos tholiformis TaxID=382380 RepID=A0ABD3RVB8_9STRA